jgi:hypothetical protein
MPAPDRLHRPPTKRLRDVCNTWNETAASRHLRLAKAGGRKAIDIAPPSLNIEARKLIGLFISKNFTARFYFK